VLQFGGGNRRPHHDCPKTVEKQAFYWTFNPQPATFNPLGNRSKKVKKKLTHGTRFAILASHTVTTKHYN
jgi:hypothetical protein